MREYGDPRWALPGDLAAAPVLQLALLLLLGVTAGLDRSGWIVGSACTAVLDVLLARGLARHRPQRLGPAGWVTLVRATLVMGIAALVAESFARGVPVGVLLGLSAVALVLDFVDGRVARRTATESRLGAALDGEVDAFLILVLSVYMVRTVGPWVLAIGLARYAFLAAGWPLTWLRATLPRRDWRKCVTAAQGIALTAGVAGVLPSWIARAGLAVALGLLAESFGRDVWWLWRHRPAATVVAAAVPEATARRGGPGALRGRRRLRAGLAGALTVLALLLVWGALVAPSQPNRLSLDAFIRLPLEGVVVTALATLLPRTGRRALSWVVGPALGVLVVVKLLDFGFISAFDRPFNPVDDWNYAHVGIETLRYSVGRTEANLAMAGLALLAVAALLLPTLAMLRVTRVAAANRRFSLRALSVLAGAWVVCWALGAQLVPGAPIASTSAAALVVDEVDAVESALHDPAHFAAAIRHDPYRSTAGDRLLTGLRGKDVLLVFVESYGKFAVAGSPIAPRVDALLGRGTRQLGAAGFAARSGWAVSSTFGGVSWLAHSTLQSGLWVDRQARYDQLMTSHRFTLSQAFRRAGWRTVDDVPSDNHFWPQGASFYHFDKVYNRLDVGYHGPTYAFASMPDQYVYFALHRLELAKRHRRPVFAEIDTVSSHEPWTMIPPLIPWRRIGDGSIFNRLPVDRGGIGDARHGYAQSIQYSLRALISFVRRYGDRNLVVIALGDHQPAHFVTGFGADHEVPVSIIARDPSVLRRLAGWGWVDGLRPTAAAPVWRMSAFRDRFLRAFGPRPAGR